MLGARRFDERLQSAPHNRQELIGVRNQRAQQALVGGCRDVSKESHGQLRGFGKRIRQSRLAPPGRQDRQYDEQARGPIDIAMPLHIREHIIRQTPIEGSLETVGEGGRCLGNLSPVDSLRFPFCL